MILKINERENTSTAQYDDVTRNHPEFHGTGSCYSNLLPMKVKKKKRKPLSRVRLFVTPWTTQSVEFSRSEYWSGSLSLFQGIFSTQGLNPGLLHCRQILYQLSHQGRPRIPKWVAYPFSRGASRLRNGTRVSCIAGGFFIPVELPRKSHFIYFQLSSVQSLSCVRLFVTP